MVGLAWGRTRRDDHIGATAAVYICVWVGGEGHVGLARGPFDASSVWYSRSQSSVDAGPCER